MLVAINPFKKVQLYGNEYIEAYQRKSIQSPHVYAIADTALREMKRGDNLFLFSSFIFWGVYSCFFTFLTLPFLWLADEVNQSIIIRWVF